MTKASAVDWSKYWVFWEEMNLEGGTCPLWGQTGRRMLGQDTFMPLCDSLCRYEPKISLRFLRLLTFGILLVFGIIMGYVIQVDITGNTIYPVYKSHNAPVTYPTMHHFGTEMCTCMHISVTKQCIVGYFLMHCGICEIGLYQDPLIFFKSSEFIWKSSTIR